MTNLFFFFNDWATTEIFTFSLHDALPIFPAEGADVCRGRVAGPDRGTDRLVDPLGGARHHDVVRSEEHTSELQSRQYLVCRLLLEKKNASVKEMTYARTFAIPSYRHEGAE